MSKKFLVMSKSLGLSTVKCGDSEDKIVLNFPASENRRKCLDQFLLEIDVKDYELADDLRLYLLSKPSGFVPVVRSGVLNQIAQIDEFTESGSIESDWALIQSYLDSENIHVNTVRQLIAKLFCYFRNTYSNEGGDMSDKFKSFLHIVFIVSCCS